MVTCHWRFAYFISTYCHLFFFCTTSQAESFCVLRVHCFIWRSNLFKLLLILIRFHFTFCRFSSLNMWWKAEAEWQNKSISIEFSWFENLDFDIDSLSTWRKMFTHIFGLCQNLFIHAPAMRISCQMEEGLMNFGFVYFYHLWNDKFSLIWAQGTRHMYSRFDVRKTITIQNKRINSYVTTTTPSTTTVKTTTLAK